MRAFALVLVLAASPAIAAHCPHGQFWRPHLGKCVSLNSPAALAYAQPLHRMRIKIALPAEPERPIEPAEVHLQDVDPDITEIPLTDPDPATMALKQQLEKQ